MKNKTLLKTNVMVCVIIVIGFMVTSIISYRSNFGIYQKDIEQVSTLTADGIYSDIGNIFHQPVSVSITMANDSLLKDFLSQERKNVIDEEYLANMQEYLRGYYDKYKYDSVFLVSAYTGRYYHFDGLDRVLLPENPENDWYYNFLNSEEEYSLNVDNDETTEENAITVFVNCKIKAQDGTVMGVVGVGLQVSSLQELLRDYEEKYDLHACLIDNEGVIEISSDRTGYERKNFFDELPYDSRRDEIIQNQGQKLAFWDTHGRISNYVVTQYEPHLKWHLVVENDVSTVRAQLDMQLFRSVIIILFIIILVLFTITFVIKRYNKLIVELTVSQELEYQRLLHESTEELYENILEVDITRNCGVGDNTRQYFENLGLSKDTPYNKVIEFIVEKQVKNEYTKSYLDTFMPENVLAAYQNGITNLSCDFMIKGNSGNYVWKRIAARIFYWNSDQSVRMIAYFKNIDEEKKHEFKLLESVSRDSMTGLYNKHATEEMVEKALEMEQPDGAVHAILMFDVDDFKTINDAYGHVFGDYVLKELADEVKTQFSENDILGRIGGDEFLVFVKNIDSIDALKQKMDRMCDRLYRKDVGDKVEHHVSCSIGAALFPRDGSTYGELCEKADQALYYAKGHGKNFFSMYGEAFDSQSFRVSHRDLEALLNSTLDGMAKFACTSPLTLLYFNQKLIELIGVPSKLVNEGEFNPTRLVHPDDIGVIEEFRKAAANKQQCAVELRMRHYDGHYFKVRVRTLFVAELYENKYPVYYAMYTKLSD
ncbi:MAG: diguanylate cyclase [Oscillospiraceae bacterium]